MTATTLLVSAIVTTAATSLFLYIGGRLSTRRMDEHSRLAATAFVVWWFGVAGFIFLWNAVPLFLALGGVEDLALVVVLRMVSHLSLALAIGCLVFYLLYLFTGQRGLVYPVMVFYALVFVALAYIVVFSDPVGVDVMQWRVDLRYQKPLGTFFFVLIGLLILPTAAGALGYFSLISKTSDKRMRMRITLVSMSILVWGLSSLLARYFAGEFWQIFTRSGIGLIAGTVIFLAYETPRWIQKRWGLPEEPEPPEIVLARRRLEVHEQRRERYRRRREKGLEWRMRELV